MSSKLSAKTDQASRKEREPLPEIRKRDEQGRLTYIASKDLPLHVLRAIRKIKTRTTTNAKGERITRLIDLTVERKR